MGNGIRTRTRKLKLRFGPYRVYSTSEFAANKASRAFSRGSWKLLFGNLSKVLAPKARSGREKVVAAIKSYFLNFNPQTTSPLMEARMANMSMLEIEDMARMECVNGLGILANTVPSAFWTIVQVYSQPKLLERVRDLAAAAVIVVTDEENAIAGAEKRKKRKKIDIIRLQRSQQQIQSIVQEVIRLRTTGIGPRLVREDVLLHDQYLLKKGSIVVIPNRAVHFDPDIWGSDVEKFDEKRFAKPPPNSHDRHTNKASNKVSSTAYRGFGGGATICPGKHFAIEGIAVFVALVVLKYDIRPAKGERGWGFLGQKMRDMALQLGSPRGKFRVELLLREGIGDVEWGFGL